MPLRRSVLLLCLLGVPYFAATLGLAARRRLWNDELYTYYFARLPSLGDVWHALATGVEQTPPFFYVLERASIAAFGDGQIALRLPATIGVFAACCLVFVVVARRASLAAGTIAALVILASNAYQYAYEARAYGVVLGFAAAALLCWQLRADTGSAAAAAGIALVLALAVSTHYYAVFLVVPLAAAELARALTRRRLDPLVPAALVLGLAPLAAFTPLIEGARRYSGTFWTTYDWGSATAFYGWLLKRDAVPPWVGADARIAVAVAVVGAALAATRALPRALPAGAAGAGPPPPPPIPSPEPPGDAAERAAAVGFLLLPLVAVAAAETVTGAYVPRYVLSAVLGLALLVPLALDRLRGRWRLLLPVVVAGLALFAARSVVYDFHDVDLARRSQQSTIAFLERGPRRSLPIAVVHQHDFLELSRYAPPALGRRLRYLADSRLALRYLGTNSSEDGLVVMSGFAPLHVRSFDAVLRSGRPFLVFARGPAGEDSWLLRGLAGRGRAPRLLRRAGPRELLYVPPAPAR